jgi:hypothetical protein
MEWMMDDPITPSERFQWVKEENACHMSHISKHMLQYFAID